MRGSGQRAGHRSGLGSEGNLLPTEEAYFEVALSTGPPPSFVQCRLAILKRDNRLKVMETGVYEIDPIQDSRWPGFLERHSSASIFHTSEWLACLQRSYGYLPAAFTTSGPGEPLTDALLFCRVRSWLTGRRLVSLPFSDHCRPLVDDQERFSHLLSRLKQECDREGEKYAEIRSPGFDAEGLATSGKFCLHRLDLRPSLDTLHHGLHKSCVRRKIVRAQREGVQCEEGTSEELLRKFYLLMSATRRRHQLPPQPLSWFRNMVACLGGMIKIRVGSWHGRPAAATVMLRYKRTMTYKYGCSDSKFHKLGAMQLLIWKTIEEAKHARLEEFDMGRSDWNQPGLLAFKDHWGCQRSNLVYLQYPATRPHAAENRALRIPRLVLAVTPECILATAGNFLYRHVG